MYSFRGRFKVAAQNFFDSTVSEYHERTLFTRKMTAKVNSTKKFIINSKQTALKGFVVSCVLKMMGGSGRLCREGGGKLPSWLRLLSN